MIPAHKICYPAFVKKNLRDYNIWVKQVEELEREFDHYLTFEHTPVYEINILASKIEELRDQKKYLENLLEKFRLEASN